MFASKGEWILYRHMALFNRIGLAIGAALLAGVGFNLIVNIQAQIGKSDFWSKYFPAWVIGNFPDKCIALSSYEASFAEDKGRKVRDLMEQCGPKVFGLTVRHDKRASDNWEIHDLRSNEYRRGGMVTCGVGGPLTGRPVDIGIIDDPIKNNEEASSVSYLSKIYDWYHSVFSTRFKEGGIKIIVMTRWSHLDLVGRIQAAAKENGEVWEEIVLPAIADKDEDWPKWGWARKAGDVVCPEIFSKVTMEKRKKTTLDFWWSTMYMQAARPRDGGEFKGAWFQIVEPEAIPKLDIQTRSWDLAATELTTSAQTAGVRMGRTGAGDDRKYFITDIVADWWKSGARDQEIKQIAQTDGKAIQILVEQEPGSGGKTQAEGIVKQLDGWSTDVIVAGNEGSKQLRADPLASAAFAGKVYIKRAPWNEKFLEQVRNFPGGKPIDMVDAAAQAFNWLSDQPDPVDLGNFDPMAIARDARSIFPIPGGSVFGG